MASTQTFRTLTVLDLSFKSWRFAAHVSLWTAFWVLFAVYCAALTFTCDVILGQEERVRTYYLVGLHGYSDATLTSGQITAWFEYMQNIGITACVVIAFAIIAIGTLIDCNLYPGILMRDWSSARMRIGFVVWLVLFAISIGLAFTLFNAIFGYKDLQLLLFVLPMAVIGPLGRCREIIASTRKTEFSVAVYSVVSDELDPTRLNSFS